MTKDDKLDGLDVDHLIHSVISQRSGCFMPHDDQTITVNRGALRRLLLRHGQVIDDPFMFGKMHHDQAYPHAKD